MVGLPADRPWVIELLCWRPGTGDEGSTVNSVVGSQTDCRSPSWPPVLVNGAVATGPLAASLALPPGRLELRGPEKLPGSNLLVPVVPSSKGRPCRRSMSVLVVSVASERTVDGPGLTSGRPFCAGLVPTLFALGLCPPRGSYRCFCYSVYLR